MDFTLDPKIEEYRKQVRAFVDAEIIPLEAERGNYDEHGNIAEETLDAVVIDIHNKQIAGIVRRDVERQIKLPFGRAGAAPLGQIRPRAVELLDPVVVPVRDVDVARGIHRDSEGTPELPVAATCPMYLPS